MPVIFWAHDNIDCSYFWELLALDMYSRNVLILVGIDSIIFKKEK